MKYGSASTGNTNVIHLAFDSTTLESLIRSGKLHVSDFNCLDKPSKRGVWSMLRSAAACKMVSS